MGGEEGRAFTRLALPGVGGQQMGSSAKAPAPVRQLQVLVATPFSCPFKLRVGPDSLFCLPSRA